MQTYCDLPRARILEIGSMNVNGSLRDFAESTTRYVGVDLDEGPGVDVVLKAGEKLPFDEASFDLVMASSAFEHDPRFWETFLEMCRVTEPGGHIYINAPSNGGVHRYPLDCWRFYPDAGLALAEHARMHKKHVEVVESFIGKRQVDSWDGWNDFVAIFRQGPAKSPMNTDFVYKKYPCYNARTWNSDKMDCETSITEDMQLGRDLRQSKSDLEEQVHNFSDSLQSAQQDLECLREELSETEKSKQTLSTELRIAEAEISHLRSAVVRFEEQARVLANALQAQSDALATVRSDAREQFNLFERQRAEAERNSDKLIADLRISEADASNLRSTVAGLESQVRILSDALKVQTDSFSRSQARDVGVIRNLEDEIENLKRETEDLQRDLAKVGEDHQSYVEETSAEFTRARSLAADLEVAIETGRLQQMRYRTYVEWLRALHIAMAGRPSWWALLPKKSRRAREFDMLRTVGLFDNHSYLEHNPDVAAEGADALDHYVAHGLNEGRNRGFC